MVSLMGGWGCGWGLSIVRLLEWTWVLWAKTANQVLSPPSKLTPLSVQNPQRANIQAEWEGWQSFPLRHSKGKRSSYQGRGDGGWLWMKKRAGKTGVWERRGIKKRDWLRNTNKTLKGQGIQRKLVPDVLKNTSKESSPTMKLVPVLLRLVLGLPFTSSQTHIIPSYILKVTGGRYGRAPSCIIQ